MHPVISEEAVKAKAKALKKALADKGVQLNHQACVEVMACVEGDKSWAVLNSKQVQIDPNAPPAEWKPSYSPWRHGGWYVNNVRYPSGAVGCVSNNYVDKKWRIACDPRRDELDAAGDFTFPSRDAAARAEYVLAKTEQADA